MRGMKTMCTLAIGALLALSALSGCSKKGGGADACGDSVAKGVDTMMAAGQKRMESSGSMAPEMKAKMDEAATKLKAAITARCTEDKWPAEVIDCYGKATSREDLKACRAKLPSDASQKLQADEMKVMMSTMGGGGMGHMGGPHMGGPHMGGPEMGSGAPPAGSGAPSMAGSGAPPIPPPASSEATKGSAAH